MPADEPKFALYVSSVQGRLVTRYGAGTRNAPSYIGARRVSGDPASIEWDTELVVALTVAEVARFAREYERTLGAKALRKRTGEDWLAQTAHERAEASAATASTKAPNELAVPETEESATPPEPVHAAPSATPDVSPPATTASAPSKT
jgi:hypothetical protein